MRVVTILKLAVIPITVLFIVAAHSNTANAATPYNLIDNEIYLDNTAMTQPQIQDFLQSKKSSLATYYDQGINDTKPELASTIIYNAAQDWGINPRVILATLQKEQSLITKQSPTYIDYRSAMGYGCPDSAACSTFYYGFANQVNVATYQFRYNYEALKRNSGFVDGDGDYHRVGQFACSASTHFYSAPLFPGNTVTFTRNVYISGTSDSTVVIANEATASLLCYTPHVGPYNVTGYSGSDNFVYWFRQWFGATTVAESFRPLDNPRWMQLGVNTQKENVYTGTPNGPGLEAGRQAFFVDKVLVKGKWYARTAYDKNIASMDAIPVDDLIDIPIEKTPDTWVSIPRDGNKVLPLKQTPENSDPITSTSSTIVVDKITVNNVEYVRTKYDRDHGYMKFIKKTDTATFTFYPFTQPRAMINSVEVKKINIKNGATISTIPKNTTLLLSKKSTLNGIVYAQELGETNGDYGIESTHFNDVINGNDAIISLETPRWMQLKNSTQKLQIDTATIHGPILTAGTQAFFIDKVNINGSWYARTLYDNTNKYLSFIPVSDIEDIPTSPVDTSWVTIKSNTQKINPLTEEVFEDVFSGAGANVIDKMTLNGKTYVRTSYEHQGGRYRFIPIEATEPFTFQPFITPRVMTTTKSTAKVNVQTGAVNSTINTNSALMFNRKISINGVLYAQLTSDNGTLLAIPASDLR